MDFRNYEGIIVSAENAELSREENAQRSAKFVHKLLDIIQWDGKIIPVEGCYEGVIEQSYMIIWDDEILFDPIALRSRSLDVLSLAFDYYQEAVVVFCPTMTVLLEIPESDEVCSMSEVKEFLSFAYLHDTDKSLMSDPMEFIEAPKEYIDRWGEDYTRVGDKYYILEM